METVLQWGLEVIRSVQDGPILDTLFEILTTLGDEEFYLLLFPMLLWTIDFGFGIRLGIVYLLSAFINTALKDLLMQPRPYDLDPSVQLSDAYGYGLPSGHSQSAVVIWGILANRVRKNWFWVLAVAMMLLIGFSRVYLGVHFPTDVFAGWGLGIVVLGIALGWGDRVEEWVTGLNLPAQMLLALLLPLLLFAIHPVKDSAAAMAALAGVGVGLAIFMRYAGYEAGGPIWQRLLRFMLGSIVVAALFLGLRMVFPDEGESFYLAFRLVRYGLVGLWVSLGAPVLFRAIGLARGPERAT